MAGEGSATKARTQALNRSVSKQFKARVAFRFDRPLINFQFFGKICLQKKPVTI